jgi:hypothetical protein
MTHTSTSGTPSPQGTDAFSPTTQLASLVDAEAPWNFLRVETNATNRNALSAPIKRKWVRVIQDDTGVKYEWNGSAWIPWESGWITYTPASIAGIAVGTGGSASSVFEYKYAAGDIRYKGRLVLGSSGASVSGVPTISVPVNHAALAHAFELVGSGVMYDLSGVAPYVVAVLVNSSNVDKIQLAPHNSGVVATAVSATVPFTWAAGDAITFDVTYKPA